MGNTASSKDRHEDTVDFGSLFPQGVYTGPQDWNHAVVGQLIVDRKLAPFYRPLEDYDDGWDDEKILAARKELPPPQIPQQQQHGHSHLPQTPTTPDHSSVQPSVTRSSISSRSSKAVGKEPLRLSEAKVYRGAVECPICFLYFPPYINHSRCCDQAICTECFVQIKRNEPTPTHLVSEPACCPYCVQENFGVVYTPPPWRAGIGSDGSPVLISRLDPSKPGSSSGDAVALNAARRKSASHTNPEVVTIDQIRPDWEAKLNAVKAAVARRANRRIIMRQVGDRLIPVGITSGRVHPIGDATTPTSGEGNGEGSGEGRRSRRRHQNNGPGGELGQLLNSMGLGLAGQDLEEMLLQEAMRLSLVEHEAEQRRQRDQQRREQDGQPGNSTTGTEQRNEPSPVVSRSAPDTSHMPSRHSQSPSVSSTASGSPRRRSHIPTVPSPLSNASAAIAMAIGLPHTESDSPTQRDASSSHLAPPPATTSSSRSHSHSRSRSSSSTSAHVFSGALASAITGAASTASAFLGADSGSPNENDARRQQSSSGLPVVVSPSILQEDMPSASIAAEGSSNPSPSPSPSAGEEERLPTRVQGVAETAVDIPTPGGHIPAVALTPAGSASPSPPHEQNSGLSKGPAPSSSAGDSPPLATPAVSSSEEPVFISSLSASTSAMRGRDEEEETDSVSLATRESGVGNVKEAYKVLPSTPDLVATAPLLPSDSASSS
ncbi:SNF1-interacting protein [Tulasnella sp. 418]|nr:SNF1-interacting protein [Tulasnella sp. 418]